MNTLINSRAPPKKLTEKRKISTKTMDYQGIQK